MKLRRAHSGFGIFGLVTVLLIVGLVASGLAPFMLTKHKRLTEDSDRAALEAAKYAIVGYAMQHGRLPTPCTNTTAPGCTELSATVLARCLNGVMPANLGVNNWGKQGRDNPFCLDTNDALRNPPLANSNAKEFCNTARAQLITPVVPFICTDTVTNHLAPAPACTAITPVAFALFSTGKDRTANQSNKLAVRIYESDGRGINDSAGDSHYDDQVVSYPLSSLLTECAKLGGKPVCNLWASASPINVGQPVILTASCSNSPNCPSSTYKWSSTPPSPALPATTSNSITTTPSTAGTYSYFVAACNEFGDGVQSALVTVVVNL